MRKGILRIVALLLAATTSLVVLTSCESFIEEVLIPLIEEAATADPTPEQPETTEAERTEALTADPATEQPETSEAPQTTAKTQAPYTDVYTPSYGSSEVKVRRTDVPYYVYWREKLDTQGQKAAYDALAKTVAEYGNLVQITEKLKFDDFRLVFIYFSLDHPEAFWLQTGYTGAGPVNSVTSVTIETSCTPAEAKARKKEIDRVVSDILSLVPAAATDFEAEKILFDWLSDNLTYDSSAENRYNLYGALVERRCVCEGYAEAMQYLCNCLGIPAVGLRGTGTSEKGTEPHKWNAVRIGGKWYQCDPTWGNANDISRYLFLNENDYIQTSHTLADELKGKTPSMNARDASYLNYYGLTVSEAFFESDFLHIVSHAVSSAFKGTPRACVIARCDSVRTAEQLASFVDDEEYSSRAQSLTDRINAGLKGEQWLIWGDARVCGKIVVFTIVRMAG